MKIQSIRWQNAREIILVAAAFWFCAEAGAATINVTSSADPVDPGRTTLRDAINAAVAGDTITVDSTIGSTITLASVLPNIAVALTITGPGATNLSIVNPNGQVFHITAGLVTVTIQGLRLSGRVTGAPGQDGQGIGVNGSNGGDAQGGAILDACVGTLVLRDCIMDNCWAIGGNGGNGSTNRLVTEHAPGTSTGGNGGFASGAAVAQTLGDLVVSNCTFFNNYAIGGNGGNGFDGGAGGMGGGADGGAVQAEYSRAVFYFINSTVYANEAIGGLGGQGGNGWSGGAPASNGGRGGAGGNAMGGGVYVNQGCQNPGCWHGIDSCTIYQNICYVGSGGAGGTHTDGGTDGSPGVNGTAYGCGLYFAGHLFLLIENTIIAGDYALPNAPIPATVHGMDVYNVTGANLHPIQSQGWNFIGNADESSGWNTLFATDKLGSSSAGVVLDPRLGPLQYNGGPTPTLAPLPCSPVIDAGKDVWGNGIDQAYQPRPVITKGISNAGDGSDIGAFELQSLPPPRPLLRITQTLADVIIAWSTDYGTCYVLQTNSVLAPVGWGNWTGSVGVANGQFQVTRPLPLTGNMFYRLLLQ